MTEPILQVNDLQMHFPVIKQGLRNVKTGDVKAVDGISFTLSQGETLGLVGESGCGKSTAGRAVLRLLEPTGGQVLFEGNDITHMKRKELRPMRRRMQMIFQDPYSSLNPRHTVGTIISAPFVIQSETPKGGIKLAVQELMERVGLNPEHYNRYPGDFSGGQRQRIGVARAIALQPSFIVLDEPVSALDVSIQAQVVNLLDDLQKDFNIAYLFVAHDLSVVRHISDRVAVMYLGQIMELASRDTLYDVAQHPYTQALLSAVPVPDPIAERQRERILLQGDLPSPLNPPSGCVFRTRCMFAQDKCAAEKPLPVEVAPGHQVACHFPQVRRAPKLEIRKAHDDRPLPAATALVDERRAASGPTSGNDFVAE